MPKTLQHEPRTIALARTLTKVASEGRLLQRELRTASFAMRSAATLPRRLPEGGNASLPGPSWIMKQAYNPNRMPNPISIALILTPILALTQTLNLARQP